MHWHRPSIIYKCTLPLPSFIHRNSSIRYQFSLLLLLRLSTPSTYQPPYLETENGGDFRVEIVAIHLQLLRNVCATLVGGMRTELVSVLVWHTIEQRQCTLLQRPETIPCPLVSRAMADEEKDAAQTLGGWGVSMCAGEWLRLKCCVLYRYPTGVVTDTRHINRYVITGQLVPVAQSHKLTNDNDGHCMTQAIILNRKQPC